MIHTIQVFRNIFEKYFCKIFLKNTSLEENTFVKYFERFQFFDLKF